MTTSEQTTAPASPGGTTQRGAALLALPLVLVTAFAVFGQVSAGYEALTPHVPADTPVVKWIAAIGASAAFESIALYVQYQAHVMLLLKATATAARHRRVSYALALLAGTVNYHHFSDEWAPTFPAIVFGAFSAVGPWLWGLYTRHVRHIHLIREGQVDSTGAVFSAERWRAFPLDTWRARRLSIDLGVDDPREAWRIYRERPAAQLEAEPVDETPAPDPEKVDERGVSLFWASAPLTVPQPTPVAPAERKPTRPATPPQDVDLERARQLIGDGAGRVVLEKELGISEHKAKQLVKTLSTNGHRVS